MSVESIKSIVHSEAARLKEAGIPSALLEAQLLTALALGISREALLSAYESAISYEVRLKIDALVARRLEGEPMAYIRGVKEFWSLTFKVDRRVMIPRPDTEILVERCLRHVREHFPGGDIAIVDVGTGSGAIACALASELEAAFVAAGDISPQAIALAKENIVSLGFFPRVLPVVADLLSPFRPGEVFHLIAANLPYIPSGEMRFLPEGTRDFEPWIALDGGREGLDIIRRLIADANRYLCRGGMLALEVDDQQVEVVMSLLLKCGVYDPRGVDIDAAGFKRVVWGVKR